jgi:hypothetical protein
MKTKSIGAGIYHFEESEPPKQKEDEYQRGFIDGSELTGSQAEEIQAIKIKEVREDERKKIIGQIENLIIEELLICRKEGTPTSRLTSLAMSIKSIDK